MNLEHIIVGDLQTNSYILSTRQPGPAVVIDAPPPALPIINALKDRDLTLDVLVLTHPHIDHIGGVPALLDAFPDARLAAAPGAIPALSQPAENLSLLLGEPLRIAPPAIQLDDGDVLQASGISLTAIALDGHADGSLCLLLADHTPPIVFTGDTLFAGSIGRSDFPGGDHNLLISGIRDSIMSLADDTIVYPGHGPDTTVAAERANPFIA